MGNTLCLEHLILSECQKADGGSCTKVKIVHVPILSLYGDPTNGQILQRRQDYVTTLPECWKTGTEGVAQGLIQSIGPISLDVNLVVMKVI
jgi:hypothetical protein